MSGYFQPFTGRFGNKKARGDGLRRAWKWILVNLGSDWLHRWDETDVRAANRALGAGHETSGFRSAAAAIFFRAVVTGALAARDAHFTGHGFVALNFLFNGFKSGHAALGTRGGLNLLGHDVITAGLDLTSFCAVSGSLARPAEHGTAGGKAERNGNESGE